MTDQGLSPLRYAAAIELPPYSYVPGHELPHPVNDPAGHLYARKDEPHEPPIAPGVLASLPTDPESRRQALAATLTKNSRWLCALELFNAGFYWEAHEVWEGFWHAEALVQARRGVDRTRELGRPVIHIRHDAGVGSPYDVTAPIGQIADPVAPLAGEMVITKQYPNSFLHTPLDEKLKRLGLSSVVLAGFMTHACVNSTARGAFNLGYHATIVAKAPATRDLPAAGGGVVPAEHVQGGEPGRGGRYFFGDRAGSRRDWLSASRSGDRVTTNREPS